MEAPLLTFNGDNNAHATQSDRKSELISQALWKSWSSRTWAGCCFLVSTSALLSSPWLKVTFSECVSEHSLPCVQLRALSWRLTKAHKNAHCLQELVGPDTGFLSHLTRPAQCPSCLSSTSNTQSQFLPACLSWSAPSPRGTPLLPSPTCPAAWHSLLSPWQAGRPSVSPVLYLRYISFSIFSTVEFLFFFFSLFF